MKLTVNKSKKSASFYVQKTIRKSNGNITTVTVEKLGNLTEITAKAAGKNPYVWAQEYVNELNRKEYGENKEIIISYSPSRLLKKGEQKSFNCGYLFLQKIYYELGLVFTRILYPASKSSSYRLGHSNIETTRFYVKVTEEMKREALHKLSDSDGSVFKDDVAFKYANDEDAIKRLCGLK